MLNRIVSMTVLLCCFGVGTMAKADLYIEPGVWTKEFARKGCAHGSVREAHQDAVRQLTNDANYYNSVCTSSEGSFRWKYNSAQQSQCQFDPNSMLCNAQCIVWAKAYCTS